MDGCEHKAKFDVDLDIFGSFRCSSMHHQSPGCKTKIYIRKKQILETKSSETSICI